MFVWCQVDVDMLHELEATQSIYLWKGVKRYRNGGLQDAPSLRVGPSQAW